MGPGRARAAGLVLLAALAMASLSVRGSPYHLFEEQADTNGILEYVTDTNLRVAQSFTPTASFTLTRVALHVVDRGTSNTVDVFVVPDLSGLPDDGTVLATGANDTFLAYEWANFDLTPSIGLSAGTTYWIILDSPGGNGNGYAWRFRDANPYPRGTGATAVGNSWTVRPGDFAFQTFGFIPAAIELRVSADRSTAISGDVIRYTVVMNNTGTEEATDAWVNATVDTRLTILNATGPGPVAILGPFVSFRATAVPTGDTIFEVVAIAEPLFDDGDFLGFPVTAEFTDGTGRQSAAGDVLVDIRAPRVTATIDFRRSTVPPGGVVEFAVVLENSGREPARHVWLNESLHPAITFLDQSSPSPPYLNGVEQSWHLTDVAPGSQSFNVTVQVGPGTPSETIITNFLSVEFTDSNGGGIVRARSNTIWFTVIHSGSAGPWLWGSFGISATIVGGTYLGYARRRLRTEEIFLIHHSGVLLVHMSKTMKADHDSDILSGMFTAIMNFVRDAFHYDTKQELQGLDIGQYRVHVRKGGITYLALVHSGKPTRWLGKAAARAVEEIEIQYGDMLRVWDGDVRAVAGVREILKGWFLSPTGPSRSMKWFRGLLARADQTFKPMRPL